MQATVFCHITAASVQLVRHMAAVSITKDYDGSLVFSLATHCMKAFIIYSKKTSPFIHPLSECPKAQFGPGGMLVFVDEGNLFAGYMTNVGEHWPAAFIIERTVIFSLSVPECTSLTFFYPLAAGTLNLIRVWAEYKPSLITVEYALRVF